MRENPREHVAVCESPDAAVGARELSVGRLTPRFWIGWSVGLIALAAVLWLPPPEGLSFSGWRTAGIATLIAAFWICECLPIPVTALLPLVLFPLFQLGTVQEAAAPFSTPIIYLFLGGFIIAMAMQRWGLHRRVALQIIGRVGARPRRIVGGFLVASALLSMWVSNSATALMMLPIAVSVLELRRAGRADDFGPALVLAVAFGATTGGMATLIGTPPNALLAAYVSKVYDVQIGFAQWMLLGVPVMLLALPGVYLLLTRFAFRLGTDELPGLTGMLRAEKERLGKLNRGEWAVCVVFVCTAAGWIFQPLLVRVVPMISDTTIAIAGAIALFVIPVDARAGKFVLDWGAARDLPWDVLLLFGGGLSLAGQIEKHGVSRYLGELCHGLGGLPIVAVIAVVCLGILFLTELTSNTATAATFLPITGAVAVSLGANPLLFLAPAALAANCSYMMPVGTPPNAIVFASGRLTLPQMAKAGLWINLLLVPIIVGTVIALAPIVFAEQFGAVAAAIGR